MRNEGKPPRWTSNPVTIRADSEPAVSLEDEIARLRDLDIEALRARWRTMFRSKAPIHLPRHLLSAIIAYRLQAEILGDLDAETLRLLKKLELAPSKDEAVPLTKALCERRRKLSPAAVGQAAAE
jgi:Protein of unknown function (DUF2924)